MLNQEELSDDKLNALVEHFPYHSDVANAVQWWCHRHDELTASNAIGFVKIFKAVGNSWNIAERQDWAVAARRWAETSEERQQAKGLLVEARCNSGEF